MVSIWSVERESDCAGTLAESRVKANKVVIVFIFFYYDNFICKQDLKAFLSIK